MLPPLADSGHRFRSGVDPADGSLVVIAPPMKRWPVVAIASCALAAALVAFPMAVIGLFRGGWGSVLGATLTLTVAACGLGLIVVCGAVIAWHTIRREFLWVSREAIVLTTRLLGVTRRRRYPMHLSADLRPGPKGPGEEAWFSVDKQRRVWEDEPALVTHGLVFTHGGRIGERKGDEVRVMPHLHGEDAVALLRVVHARFPDFIEPATAVLLETTAGNRIE